MLGPVFRDRVLPHQLGDLAESFLYDKCDGFGPETVERAFPIRLYDGTTAPPIRETKVTAKLKRREPLSANDFSARKATTRGSIKANLPTPSVAHFFTGDAVLDRTARASRGPLSPEKTEPRRALVRRHRASVQGCNGVRARRFSRA
jgi:hypothetical protein